MRGTIYFLIFVGLVLSFSEAKSLREIYNQHVRSLQKMERPMDWVPSWLAQHERVV